MAIIYQNGTVVSVPKLPFNRSVDRSANAVDKCFGLSFKTKMKIFDAAHIQHLEMSNAPRFADRETGELLNADHNHVFLTPTFDMANVSSFAGPAANEALQRFTDNLSKRYGATSYLWVKEFTERLTPHYHMLVTLPSTPIADLNRAWSHARGDVTTVRNALRTGYDPKTKRSVMKVRNYKQAVGYAAKYITKAGAGDICVLKTSCRVSDRQVWEFRSGHSTKCYGMSQNLLRPPRQLDLFYQFHLHPWLTREVKEVKNDFSELYFFDRWETANMLYRKGTEIVKVKPKKIAAIVPKKPNYHPRDQTFIEFPQ